MLLLTISTSGFHLYVDGDCVHTDHSTDLLPPGYRRPVTSAENHQNWVSLGSSSEAKSDSDNYIDLWGYFLYIWCSGASSYGSELKASPTIEIRPLSDWQLTSTLGSPIRHDKKFKKSVFNSHTDYRSLEKIWQCSWGSKFNFDSFFNLKSYSLHCNNIYWM